MPDPHEIEITVDDTETASVAPRPTMGNYQLVASLGRGGMGDVFLAVRQGLAGFSKLVVIKQLRPSLVNDTELLKGFLDEARLAARLNHPNIVQTNEVGQDSSSNYFIAMEYLDGQTMHHLIKKDHVHEHRQRVAINVLVRVLDGLHYAHEATDYDGTPLQIVHRDMSPQNVFVTYEGDVKILDFGIAKAISSTVETRAGVYKGKLPYMSPEQMNGDPLDRRADVFSVGVMLWAVVAGRSLWHGRENMEIARNLMAGQIPHIHDVYPEAPQALVDICQRAVAARPSDRYATALELRQALYEWLTSTNGVLSREQLATEVSTLFADERRQTQRSIETYIREAKSAPPLPVSQLPVIDLGTSEFGSGISTAARSSNGPSSVVIHTHNGWKVAAIVVPIALVCGAGAMYALLARAPARVETTAPVSLRAAPQAAPTIAPTVSVPAPPEPTPATPTTAALTIRTKPETAKLTLDGVVVDTPWEGQVEFGAHELRVEAAGFEPQTSLLNVKQATQLEIVLQREATKKRPGRGSAPAVAAPKGKTEPVEPADKPKSKPAIEIIADPSVQILE